MRSTGTFSIERCDAWGSDRSSERLVAEAVRGALREVVVVSTDGACEKPGACRAEAPCVACMLFGAPNRRGRVSVWANADVGAGLVSFVVDHGEEDTGRVVGAAKAVRRIGLGGRQWRVRKLELGADAEAGAGRGDKRKDAESPREEASDFASLRLGALALKSSLAGVEAEAEAVAVRVVAQSPLLVAAFTWGDGFRAGASPVIPGSQLRGALGVEGGRVSHLRVSDGARARLVVRRGGTATFAEEAWEAGTSFEGRIDGGRFVKRDEGKIGAGRNRGYGRIQLTYSPAKAAGVPEGTSIDCEGVTVGVLTAAVVRDRAALGRAIFGEVSVALRRASIARGPTGADVTWVRGRPAIPAGSEFQFSFDEGDRESAWASLGRALRTGVGEGASDGYGELRIVEMKK